jgi:hypothetical protein
MAWEGEYACGCGAPGMPRPLCNASDGLDPPKMPPGFIEDEHMKKLTRSGRVPFEIPPAVARAFIDDMRAFVTQSSSTDFCSVNSEWKGVAASYRTKLRAQSRCSSNCTAIP